MITAAGPPPKAGANGVRAGQGGSGDGCCDNVGARAQALIERVPPCTSKYAFMADKNFQNDNLLHFRFVALEI